MIITLCPCQTLTLRGLTPNLKQIKKQPFASERHLQMTFNLNFNFEIRRNHQKLSYERRSMSR